MRPVSELSWAASIIRIVNAACSGVIAKREGSFVCTASATFLNQSIYRPGAVGILIGAKFTILIRAIGAAEGVPKELTFDSQFQYIKYPRVRQARLQSSR